MLAARAAASKPAASHRESKIAAAGLVANALANFSNAAVAARAAADFVVIPKPALALVKGSKDETSAFVSEQAPPIDEATVASTDSLEQVKILREKSASKEKRRKSASPKTKKVPSDKNKKRKKKARIASSTSQGKGKLRPKKDKRKKKHNSSSTSREKSVSHDKHKKRKISVSASRKKGRSRDKKRKKKVSSSSSTSTSPSRKKRKKKKESSSSSHKQTDSSSSSGARNSSREIKKRRKRSRSRSAKIDEASLFAKDGTNGHSNKQCSEIVAVAPRQPPPVSHALQVPDSLLPTGISQGCDMREYLQAAQLAAARRLQAVPVSAAAVRPGDWFCPICNAHNYASKYQCFRCVKGTNPLLSATAANRQAVGTGVGGSFTRNLAVR